MTARPWSPTLFREAARNIAAISQRLYEHGWSPATSSNYSMRLNADYCAVTVSGKDKGTLNEADVMVVDMQGVPASNGKPSAETGLHTQIYRRFADIGAVLHTHSLASTVLTMHWPDRNELVLKGYELLKALDGVNTHDTELTIPIFDNTQDIDALAGDVDAAMAAGHIRYAYLIRGHGIYTWAKDMATCFRQIEALEVLLAVELERRKIGA
ncbi:MAG: methylthioribulose 1-phosphate dehydratase [Alcanivoracaceae bacterium]|nr:methylthioribulose 1-phosphate dehydratase [Alcanivoracaceae bacterium]